MILYGDSVPRKDAAGNVIIDRVLRTKPHPTYEAGDRTGRLPEIVPLDYDAFVSAFNLPNSQVKDTQSPMPAKNSAVNTSNAGSIAQGKESNE